ncbi:hypothetical protein M426DRAFT_26446 [Hypoxylon sp. CI-4A]|nr:hypothetical protein M426DRAFT_26446 [Hypoxylon sp. CI-4A]
MTKAITTDEPARQQPRRTVRDKAPAVYRPLPSPASKAGVQKRAVRGGQAKVRKALEARVAAMDAHAALEEQRGLLNAEDIDIEIDAAALSNGAPIDLSPLQDSPPPTPAAPAAPKPTKGKRGRKKKPAKEKKYMDDFLLSDDDEEEGGENEREQGGGGDRLRRGDRWIPEMENRKRPAKKPRGVSHQVWMSYCFLDDFIYRSSLTEEEVLTYPLLDQMYAFQQGDTEEPVTPAGFQWDETKRLVPIQENVTQTEAL